MYVDLPYMSSCLLRTDIYLAKKHAVNLKMPHKQAGPKAVRPNASLWLSAAVLTFAVSLKAQATDDSQARPPVTQADIQIVKRARTILDSPSKWNRADTRVCPAGAKTFSLYC